MNIVLKIILPLLILPLLTGCSIALDEVRYSREAEAGLTLLLSQLPNAPEFVQVKISQSVTRVTDLGEESCYLARAYLLLGSALDKPKALDRYYQLVQQTGWVPRAEQYPETKVLFMEPTRIMALETNPNASILPKQLNYAELEAKYQSLIFVRVDYFVPKQC